MNWQARYESEDTPWDKGVAAPGLRQFLEKPQLFIDGSRVVVPGCGFGYDAVVIARENCSVVGLDISDLAVKKAKSMRPWGLDLEYHSIDLFEYDGPLVGSFDLVWEHTFFCAIELDKRAEYVEVMWRFLKPGGYLAGVFFVDPFANPLEGPPFMSTLDSVRETLGARFSLEWQTEPLETYPGREGRELLLLFKRMD